MNSNYNKSDDTYNVKLTAEELNAILCAFDEARKTDYASPQTKFIQFANDLHDELAQLYVEC